MLYYMRNPDRKFNFCYQNHAFFMQVLRPKVLKAFGYRGLAYREKVSTSWYLLAKFI